MYVLSLQGDGHLGAYTQRSRPIGDVSGVYVVVDRVVAVRHIGVGRHILHRKGAGNQGGGPFGFRLITHWGGTARQKAQGKQCGAAQKQHLFHHIPPVSVKQVLF